jgi:hypothetical protein
MKELPELNLLDEAEMRAFYASCGVSTGTTEAAIKVRREIGQQQRMKRPHPLKVRRQKPVGT